MLRSASFWRGDAEAFEVSSSGAEFCELFTFEMPTSADGSFCELLRSTGAAFCELLAW